MSHCVTQNEKKKLSFETLQKKINSYYVKNIIHKKEANYYFNDMSYNLNTLKGSCGSHNANAFKYIW